MAVIDKATVSVFATLLHHFTLFMVSSSDGLVSFWLCWWRANLWFGSGGRIGETQ